MPLNAACPASQASETKPQESGTPFDFQTLLAALDTNSCNALVDELGSSASGWHGITLEQANRIAGDGRILVPAQFVRDGTCPAVVGTVELTLATDEQLTSMYGGVAGEFGLGPLSNLFSVLDDIFSAIYEGRVRARIEGIDD